MDTLGEEGRERIWSQIYDLFIEPELTKRSDIDWSDIYKVLIKLPQDRAPIVEFNNEVTFLYAVEDPVVRTVGETLGFDEIRAIKEIHPPKVDDRSVAFVYAWCKGDHIYFAFDCSPNWPDFDEENHKLGAGLQYRLECEALEHILAPVIHSEDRLLEIGVSIFPALIPFPLNAVAKNQLEGETDKALRVMEEHCDVEFIKEQVADWHSVHVLEERKELIDEALQAHSSGLYHMSINALVGQIEGIVTDWLYRSDEANTPWKAESKFKEFQRLVESVIPVETLEVVILQSVSRFLVSPDTILRTFSDWKNPELNVDSVSRHVIQHGKYVPEYYTKGNSIKMFLVIDSIKWCIQCYEFYKREIHAKAR